MALPRVVLPTYSIKLPGIKKTVKYRAYITAEEKLLLMAMESNDHPTIVEAMKTLVSNCLLTSGVSVEDLPTFDLDLLFLNIRAKSVGEIAEIRFVNKECEKHTEGGCYQDLKIDLTKLTITTPPGHSRKISITDKIGMEMRYPSFRILQQIQAASEGDTASNAEVDEQLAIACIATIWEGDDIFPTDDESPEELRRFFGSLPVQAKQKIIEFFQTMPSIRYETTVCCGKCGANVPFVATGPADFFELASVETH